MSLESRSDNVHAPFSREEDVILWRARNDDVDDTARRLGRGPKGVAARLQRLQDPSTAGYKRLFGDDEECKAAMPLRPVRDCVQRILWDDALSLPDFSVGYHDRFRAIAAEVRFDQANTGEGHSITSHERLFVLALPEHRIEYLKYKRRVVWHKVCPPVLNEWCVVEGVRATLRVCAAATSVLPPTLAFQLGV